MIGFDQDIHVNGGIPAIVAHRGASADAPENTLEAFNLAWQQEADAIEGDFHLTMDGHIICHHDPEISVKNGQRLVIKETMLRDLQPANSTRTAPVLSQVLDIVPQGKGIFIEVKCGAEIVVQLVDVVNKSILNLEQVTIISFDENVIAGIKEQMPSIRAHWLVDFKGSTIRLNPDARSIAEKLHLIRANGVGVKADPRISRAFVASLQSEGFEVHAWTVDAKLHARHFFRVGVDAITTNRPDKLRTFLDQFIKSG